MSSSPSSAPLFRERLTPSPAVWFLTVLFGGSFGIIMIPLSLRLAAFVAVGACVGMCVWMWTLSPVVEVTAQRFRAGRASIDPALLGEADAPTREESASLMSTGYAPLAYHCTRAWVPDTVRVQVSDPEDPTPYWLVSSRHPQELAAALREATLGSQAE
ncbi:DUF3093 domain-containing protein [Dermabacteraceae bacterium TAE3-ERU27]|nr:DUF3093 domain-containing protein [Dermabacteraceae bacterium TAE3-ERU27]